MTSVISIASTELLKLVVGTDLEEREEGDLLRCEELSINDEIIDHDITQIRSLMTYSAWLKLNEEGIITIPSLFH